MIKEIHCLGTSNTEGGGFEFFDEDRGSKLKMFYVEQPQTQFNYSYPGQLQKMMGDKIKIYNHGKSGYGNEIMYRISYDLIKKNIKNLGEILFIFEFSYLGRKEFFSNTLNDYFVVNYQMTEKDVIVKNIFQTYKVNQSNTYNSLKNIVIPFMKETMNPNNQLKLLEMNNELFVNFLIQKKVNFLFSNPPYMYENSDILREKCVFYNDEENNMCKYYFKNGWTIKNETMGLIDDNHAGLRGNYEIAKKILEKINNIKEYVD